ncbi:MAG: 50S ribosomal protein L9 [Eubacterium sp.]|nr:50S ribosomal protein L9 [Eubacterium sp.]
MIVILKRDVKGTGKAGDVVKVSDGFARNMLLPKGLAEEATKNNVHTLEKAKEKREEEEKQARAAAEKQAEEMKTMRVEINTKAGEGGKLFGSITTKDIADALKEQHGLSIDKRKIVLDQPIKETGVKRVKIRIYPEITATIAVEVKG